jgi:(1->4)-alpha-D-glucan 1-alpha-D-glucosylmutase
VGSDPARWGEPIGDFHEKKAQRLARWPESFTSTSSHDTKRGEDVRARISVLSEVPNAWAVQIRHWRMIARRWKQLVGGRLAPDKNDEYLLYQTLCGAWPTDDAAGAVDAFATRVSQYMEKAIKEAKRHTSWINPNPDYDAAMRNFVAQMLAAGSPFVEAFRPFQQRVAFYGMLNSLAQTVLKITAPGIPDFYQGSELWDLSLVDPDNRRPVDFTRRQALLDAMLARTPDEPTRLGALCAELLESWPDGRVKLYATHRGLTLRRELARLFASGSYQPLSAGGDQADHVIGFARLDRAERVVAVVPRLSARLTGFSGRLPLGPEVWGDTWISLGDRALEGAYRDRFSGARVATEMRDGVPSLAARLVFANFPVALLARESVP